MAAPPLGEPRRKTALAMGAEAKAQLPMDALRLLDEDAAAGLRVKESQRALRPPGAALCELLRQLDGRRRVALDPLVQEGQKPTAFLVRYDPKGAVPRAEGHWRLSSHRSRWRLEGAISERARLRTRPSRV